MHTISTRLDVLYSVIYIYITIHAILSIVVERYSQLRVFAADYPHGNFQQLNVLGDSARLISFNDE